MHVGFTGTQHGCTEEQRRKLAHIFSELALAGHLNTTLHHGDCIGADKEAHTVAYYLGWKIEVHPPLKDDKRAHVEKTRLWSPSMVMHEPVEYMERNEDIVATCEVIVACPKTHAIVQRSGTWATVRRARAAKKRVVIVYPDGTYNSDWR